MMKFVGRAVALLSVSLAVSGPAWGQATSYPCTTHLFPAAKLSSVGEDFDQVKRVDQDLHMYDQLAGRPLNWLTTARQAEIMQREKLGGRVGLNEVAVIVHEPLTRLQARDPAPKVPAAQGCTLEVMVPQVLLERGGLATRSLRLFAVVRHFENGELVHGYSGFAAAPMRGFRMTGPQDADAATAIVEGAFVTALSDLMANSLGQPKTQNHP